MTCEEITQHITKIAEYKNHFDVAMSKDKLGIADAKDSRAKVDSLFYDELKEFVDSDQLKLRQEIAKKLGQEYVSQVYDGQVVVGKIRKREKGLPDFKNCYTLIDPKGENEVKKESPVYAFCQISSFFDGVAWARQTNGFSSGSEQKYVDSIIGMHGEFIYKFPQDHVFLSDIENWDGMPIAIKYKYSSDKQRKYVNKKGDILDGNFINHDFHDGVIWTLKNDRFTLIDTDGKVLAQLNDVKVDNVDIFHGDFCLAFYFLPNSSSRQVNVMDKRGHITKLERIILDSEWFKKTDKLDLKLHYENGLYYGWNKEEGHFTFNVAGEKTVYGDNAVDHVFGNGLFLRWHWDEGQRTGYIENLEKEIPEPYRIVTKTGEFFCEGMLWFHDYIDGEYYFLNMKADRIGEGYLAVKDYSEGLAAVRDEQGWFFIDKQGRNPFANKNMRFHSLPDKDMQGYKGGVILVEDFYGKEFYIDKRGRQVF